VGINFYYEDISGLHLPKRKIRNWINSAICEENKKSKDLSFIFCSDSYLLKINQQYLEHDYYTDIITFDYVEGDWVSGDIFISVERVKENAEIFKVLFMNELCRIMIHGVLHLLGYKDKQKDHKSQMTERENYYLNKIKF